MLRLVDLAKSYGARPIKRALQRELENALAKQLLSGSVRDGQHVRVDYDGKALTFHAERVTEPEAVTS